MSRALTRVLVVTAIVAGAVYGVVRLTAPRPVAVVVRAVERGPVEATVANTRAGTVNAHRRAGIAPSIPGQVVALLAHEGDAVTEGQLLLRLWSKDLAAQLELARAEERRAQALHEEACARAEVAGREAERLVQLLNDGIASEEEVDQALSQAKALRAACRAAEAGAEVGARRIATIEADLEQTVLKAPFAGIVAEVNAELGEFVTPSPVGIPTPPAIDLIDRSSLYVKAPLDEVDAPAVRVGMPARVTLDAFKGEAFDGKVTRVAPYVLDVEKQSRTVDVEVVLDDPAALDRLLPGYSADVEVVLDVRSDALRVPTEAVLDGDRVLVFDPTSEELREVVVRIGLASWRFTEVLDGLTADDLVVVSLDRAGVVAGAHAEVERRDDSR